MKPANIQRLIGDLMAIGYHASVDVDAVWCTLADGSGSIAFESLEAAASWLADGEGLVPLQRRNLDLDVSVHRRDGILTTEMAHVPDQPMFDVIALTVPDYKNAMDFWETFGDAVWLALVALPFCFAYALSDVMSESLAEYSCVHRCIAANRLPPFLPWLCAVPERSPLSVAIGDAARIAGRSLIERDGLQLLTLSDTPYAEAERTVSIAGSRWRQAMRDGGCV